MRFTLHKEKDPTTFWNGVKPLPDEINVLQFHPEMAEFELLSVLCALHGFVTAFDILTGSESGSEKDTDINSVMEAFHAYLWPRMPLSHYTAAEKRMKSVEKKGQPIDS